MTKCSREGSPADWSAGMRILAGLVCQRLMGVFSKGPPPPPDHNPTIPSPAVAAIGDSRLQAARGGPADPGSIVGKPSPGVFNEPYGSAHQNAPEAQLMI